MIDEGDVALALKRLGVEIAKEKSRGVTAQLQRIADIAETLEAVELDPFTDEIAPVWRP